MATVADATQACATRETLAAGREGGVGELEVAKCDIKKLGRKKNTTTGIY